MTRQHIRDASLLLGLAFGPPGTDDPRARPFRNLLMGVGKYEVTPGILLRLERPLGSRKRLIAACRSRLRRGGGTHRALCPPDSQRLISAG